MEITDDAQAGALIGEFTVTFDDSRTSGGTISTVVDGAVGTYDDTTGLLSGNAQSGPLTIDIGRPLEARGLSQLSDVFAPVSITKDGSPVGNLASIEVDEGGLMFAVYDTGFARAIYQVPVVDVPNANGLQALPNQTYQVSSASGAFYLWDAGDGPVGDLVGFAREESSTDVASELTSLIQTQRAYNSNAKVIQTVDEMLQETTNIKR
jgi:flagellar hook protein FlgE